jgi:hypothetical protein
MTIGFIVLGFDFTKYFMVNIKSAEWNYACHQYFPGRLSELPVFFYADSYSVENEEQE